MRILAVDDDPCLLELLSAKFRAAGIECDTAECLSETAEMLRRHRYDGILLDVHLGDEDGLDALPVIMRESPATRVFVMTAQGSVEVAVDAMEKGATSFLVKTGDPGVLVEDIRNRLGGYDKEVRSLESAPASGLKASDFGLIGESRSLQRVLDYVDILRDVDSRVLITGESGTGKEVVAKALHTTSRRAGKRFEAINCGAIPENLLESELFGHKRGAFTDAKADHKGFFETCSDGTLFLDEIGEMPLQLQVKLLRVLQESRVTPVGSNQSIKVNTRVIAATNRSLEDEVRKGRFREDLFYRISVLKIHLPPLRERRSDIPLLVNYFLGLFNIRFGKTVSAPAQDLMARLSAKDWPGNIRELQNCVERGVVLSCDQKLHLEHMLEDQVGGDAVLAGPAAAGSPAPFADYLAMPLSEAARICGRYRADIYRLMVKYGMSRECIREELGT